MGCVKLVAAVRRDVRGRTLVLRLRPLLNILGYRDMTDSSASQRSLDCLVDDVDEMGWTHHPLVVGGDIHIQLVEIDILLIVSADQVVKGMARNGKDRLQVAFCVVETVQKMNASGTGGREAHSETSGELGVAAGGEGGRLFVSHLDEPHLVLVRAQSLEDAVNAISRKTKNGIDSPLDQPLD